MISIKVSANSSTLVQDIINQCTSISPIANWSGFYYQSTVGSKPWRIWAQRVDTTADEMCVVSADALAVAPDGYELQAITFPTITGFTLSFTQVNGPVAGGQSSKGAAGGGGSSSVPLIHVRMSAKPATAVADLIAVMTALTPAKGRWNKYFYKSTTGSGAWEAYAICTTITDSTVGPEPPPTITLITMGGLATPPTGSEQAAIACPTLTGFTQIGAPLNIYPS